MHNSPIQIDLFFLSFYCEQSFREVLIDQFPQWLKTRIGSHREISFWIYANETEFWLLLQFSDDLAPNGILFKGGHATCHIVYTLSKLYFLFVSNRMGHGCGDSFPPDFEPNGIPFGSKSNHDHIPFDLNRNIVFSVCHNVTLHRGELAKYLITGRCATNWSGNI